MNNYIKNKTMDNCWIDFRFDLLSYFSNYSSDPKYKFYLGSHSWNDKYSKMKQEFYSKGHPFDYGNNDMSIFDDELLIDEFRSLFEENSDPDPYKLSSNLEKEIDYLESLSSNPVIEKRLHEALNLRDTLLSLRN